VSKLMYFVVGHSHRHIAVARNCAYFLQLCWE